MVYGMSGGGGAVALGARGSEPSMITGGPRGQWISPSPARRHARSGRCTGGKVEWGLDSWLAVP
jgi:hypothetical protein